MAEVAKSNRASVDTTTALVAPQRSGKLAGENLAALDFIYMKSDGLWWRANGAAANAAARARGITPVAVRAGQPVTCLGLGQVARYSDQLLTPGQLLFLSGVNPGGLADAASVGDAVGVAEAYDDTNIIVRAF